MKTIGKLCGVLGALLLSSSVYAGDIKVEGAWARATAPGQEVAMVDLSITSSQHQQPASPVGWCFQPGLQDGRDTQDDA